MYIDYSKVSSLGQKKLEIFNRVLSSAIPEGSAVKVDEIIKKYTTEKDHFLLVRLAGNSIAGIIAFRVEGVEGYIDYLAVAKKYRNNNHGRLLINHFIEQNCVQKVTLECGINSATFFEKVGFKVSDQFENKSNIKRFKFERKVDKQVYL